MREESSNGTSEKQFVLNADGSILIDHNGKPVGVNRYLCTKPLRAEVSTRKGPGGIKLTYMGGDIVTKSLNEAFGYDGWCLEVKNTTREEPIKDDKGRYHVAYSATVRITLRHSGVFREDCGAGDSIDRSLASASGNALKGAVTDAMKRAARHFGEKMGNSLYHDGFNANKAPSTLKDALDSLDIERAKSRFGFDKDRKIADQMPNSAKPALEQSNKMAPQKSPTGASVKQEPKAHSSYGQQSTRTQYVGGVSQSKAIQAKPHATPYNGAGDTAQSMNTTSSIPNAGQPTNGAYVTPGNRTAAISKKSSPFDPSVFAAVPAEKLGNKGKENCNPQSQPLKKGLALPPRPGTSRGLSPTSASLANLPDITCTPSMFGANGAISQAMIVERQGQTSIAQSLKRKLDGTLVGAIAESANTSTRNPYSC